MEWPNNKRIAIMIAFDVDGETLWLTRGDGQNAKHLTNMSRGRYDTLQGIPRLLRLLEEENIPATFFTPAYMAERYPEVVKEIVRCGHEIGYHGYLHEVYDNYEQENALMDKCEQIITNITGKRPIGHRAPNGTVYDFCLRLWAERGYIYSSNWRDNDGPVIHKLGGKEIPLVELPKDSIFDDTAYDMYTENDPARLNLRSGREMVQNWKDEFDGLAAENRMINFVLHPQFIGRPCYTRALRDFIHYAKENGAWFATNEEVARYVISKHTFD